MTGFLIFILALLPIATVFLLLVVLFCMGTQSALFGPVKYSILPQQLTEDELVGGNALVEMGTFLAILGGTIGAGVLMASDAYAEWVALSVVLIALVGYLASLAIPAATAALPTLHMDWHVLRQSWRILRLGFGQQRAVQGAAEQLAMWQGAAVEHRVAFAPGGQQAGLGEYLEMMAHPRLADGKDLRQLEHAEGVAGQHAQHVQAQRIATGLAQGGELVAGVVTDLGKAQAHRPRSLVGHFSYSKGSIKKF